MFLYLHYSASSYPLRLSSTHVGIPIVPISVDIPEDAWSNANPPIVVRIHKKIEVAKMVDGLESDATKTYIYSLKEQCENVVKSGLPHVKKEKGT